MSLEQNRHTSWVEVNLPSLKHNLKEIRQIIGPSVKVMAVVKADAYGHGAVETSKALVEAGADYLGVTTLEEALKLRDGGIESPTLVFSPLLPDQINSALSAGVEQTICDLTMAEAISAKAVESGKWARVHVKVDTGMGRLGVTPGECVEFMYRLTNLPGIEVAGIYTHFANSGAKNLSHAWTQFSRFKSLLELLESKDIPVGLRHAANSSAILNIPDAHLDMVRPGTILYGQYPSQFVQRKLDLKETWCWKARIVALRKLPPGMKVGYGSEYTTSRTTTAAVIPVGYSDGFTLTPESVARRMLSPLRLVAGRLLRSAKCPYVSVQGRRAPVIGRVSMQMCSVDVTGIPGIQAGDEVVIPARRTTTSSRIPRVYVGE